MQCRTQRRGARAHPATPEGGCAPQSQLRNSGSTHGRSVIGLSPDVATQIDSAYRLAFSRAPTPEEKERLAAYAHKHDPAYACHVLLNSTEFMFVD